MHPRPVLFLAFADDRVHAGNALRNLPEEARALDRALNTPEALWDVVLKQNTTLDTLLDVFQDARYRDRIVTFHFAGHAGSYELLFESRDGAPVRAHAGGLADILAAQHALKLVFLNGCSTLGHVEGLLEAGVPAVIATSTAIDDAVATEVATRFYGLLAAGASVGLAYGQAAASVRTRRGTKPRDVYRRDAHVLADHWPWALHIREGAEAAAWNLGDASGDPTFPLPPLPARDLPERPFRYLDWFHAQHAELFFGRGAAIRELYERVTSPESAPLILLYGQSGVGKSSLLAAGLIPRLEATHTTRYARRDADLGLAGSLRRALDAAPGASIPDAWATLERDAGRPLILILDQVEEAWAGGVDGDPREVADFTAALAETFGARARRPQGRLILGFRKEWYAEIDAQLAQHELPRIRVFLQRLDRAGIIEAVSGLTRRQRLVGQYGLTIDDALPGIIADDLLEDRDSPIAPTVQVLLSKMWDHARQTSPSAPAFTLPLYRDLKRDGILLGDFLDQQLEAIATAQPEATASGFVLDFLAFFASDLGTAIARSGDELDARYAHRRDTLPALLDTCRKSFLLVESGEEQAGGRAFRLAHDTLAPLVRRRFEESDAPGQRARRILESRAAGWTGGRAGDVLDDADLVAVEAGRDGMRAWSVDEARLIEASRKQAARKARSRRIWKAAGVGAAVLILGLAAATTVTAIFANRDADRVRMLSVVGLASSQDDPLLAGLLMAELQPSRVPVTAVATIASVAQRLAPVIVLEGHTDAVMSAAFRSDGALIVTASADGIVRVFNANGSGDPVELKGHSEPVVSAAFSPDGTRIVTASSDRTARVFNADGSGIPVELDGHRGPVVSAAFSPDGTRVVTASSDRIVRVFNADGSGNPVELDGHRGVVRSAAFSPDGARIVTASFDSTARVFNADGSGNPVVLYGHTGSVENAAFSPDGARIVTASFDSTARIFSADGSGVPVVLYGHTGKVENAAFNRNGSHIVTASADGTARVFNADGSGDPVILEGHTDVVESAVFSPDGTRVITASSDRTARLFNADGSGAPVVLEGHTAEVGSAAFSPDGTRIVTASLDGTARLFSVDRFGEPIVLEGDMGPLHSAAFSPDGTLVVAASSDSTVRVFNADGSGEPGVLKGHTDIVRSAIFSPDGLRIITASSDSTARVFSADGSGEPAVLAVHGAAVMSAALSPGGNRVVTASFDRTARVFNADGSDTPVVLHRHTSPVVSATFSPDGSRIVTASYDGKARVFNADGSGEPIVLEGHGDPVVSAAFSPDGSRIVTASYDRTARVFNADGSGQTVLLEHTDLVQRAVFSSDGNRISTASYDGIARVFNADGSGEPIVLEGHGDPVVSVDFDADGTRIVTASFDGTARVWRITIGDLLDYIRSAVAANCLKPADRVRLLAEDEREARRTWEACERRNDRTPAPAN